LTRIVERIDVHPASLFYQEHLARYRFAAMHLDTGWTLDIACGSGYGASVLCQPGEVRVAAADIYVPSLKKAREGHADPRIVFLAVDGTALAFRDRSFQNIVTLETIEHIKDDHGYLRELGRILRPDGACILSTPNRAYSLRHRIANPYHVREYSYDELVNLLHGHFAAVDVYHQGFSRDFADRVSDYATLIQTRKSELNPAQQFLTERVYGPIKGLVPAALVNFFIRKWLRLAYPQPDPNDITISREPLEDSSVLIAICSGANTA
jgi:ubiquinone/menaquinone biosynthesis C-methylase UbiE